MSSLLIAVCYPISTAYINYLISFSRVEIQLSEITSILLTLYRDKSSAALTVQVRCRRA